VVQTIELGDEPHVERVMLDEDNRGQVTINSASDRERRVVLVIGGMTPFTTELATYEYQATTTE
jgi:hypothetical protein